MEDKNKNFIARSKLSQSPERREGDKAISKDVIASASARNDSLHELPKGWVWTKVGETIEKVSITGKKLKQSEYREEGKLPVIDQGQTFVGGYTDKEELKVRCEPPVIVFGDHTKVFKYVDFEFVAGADGVKVINPLEVFYPKLFYYFLNAIQLPDKGYARHFQFLEKSFIPLPPLPEQQRIVAKIEELFTNLDAGVEALKKVKAQLKRYRQAVLKYAFEGKLTEKWREKHKNELEPASLLLEQIREERKKNTKGSNVGATGRSPLPVDTSDLPELPEGWVWTKVGEIYDIVGGGTPSTEVEEYWNGDIPWITSADIQGLKDIRPRRHINKKAIENSATNLVPEGSLIVVTRVGLGKIALINNPICFSQDSQALISSNLLMYPDYSLYYLSQAVQIFKYKHRGTTIAGVTKKQLSELTFALPPLSEQHKIVEEIERRFSVADKIEKVVEGSLKQSERLRQSILKKAFEGKLVPQNPSDEPAEKLLERIK